MITMQSRNWNWYSTASTVARDQLEIDYKSIKLKSTNMRFPITLHV